MKHLTPSEDAHLPTAEDLRAALARKQLHLYQIAPTVQIHPNRLSALLNERSPLSPDVALRIQRAIEQAQPMERRGQS
jgi:plasmid maintenance system antidote protein VapI